MKQLLKFPLPGKDWIWVEIDVLEDLAGNQKVGRIADLTADAYQVLEATLDKVVLLPQKVLERLKRIERPDEIELKFGVKLTAEAGVVVASTAAEANFDVTLKWKKS